MGEATEDSGAGAFGGGGQRQQRADLLPPDAEALAEELAAPAVTQVQTSLEGFRGGREPADEAQDELLAALAATADPLRQRRPRSGQGEAQFALDRVICSSSREQISGRPQPSR
jgi:hypothetical protein